MSKAKEREQKERDQEKNRAEDLCEALNALIAEQVVHTLGKPEDLHKVQVRSLWGNYFRVGYVTGAWQIVQQHACRRLRQWMQRMQHVHFPICRRSFRRRLFLQRLGQSVQCGIELVQLQQRCQPHTSRKHVIRRLASVHMIVRVDVLVRLRRARSRRGQRPPIHLAIRRERQRGEALVDSATTEDTHQGQVAVQMVVAAVIRHYGGAAYDPHELQRGAM
jgi:hypothetical protein